MPFGGIGMLLNSSFGILLGHGDGTFASAINYNLSSEWPVSSAAGLSTRMENQISSLANG
jgi:hypothetical protein